MNNTGIYGIIGDDINYSLSPVIYRKLFEWKQIDAVYNIFNLKQAELASFVGAVRLLGLNGFNVTTPHKRRILEHIDKADRLTKLTQSANLVINRGGKLYAYNTDFQGVKQSIESLLKYDVKGGNVAVLGSGGAAQTVYYYLVRCSPARITVYHHSPERLLRFGAYARTLQRFTHYRAAIMDGLIDMSTGCDLCINCTPTPLTDLIVGKSIDRIKRIFELRYGEYPLLKRGHIRGDYMLAVQAAASFEAMTGIRVNVTRVVKIINEVLKRD